MKIDLAQLRRLIITESQKQKLEEDIDHAAVSALVSSASKLMGAITAFKAKAGTKASSLLGSKLDDIVKVLEIMIKSPGQVVKSDAKAREEDEPEHTTHL